MNYKPIKVFAIAAMLLFAVMFASSEPAPAASDVFASSAVEADSVTPVEAATVDVNTVTVAEVQSENAWVRRSVGKHVLNARLDTFEPVDERAGYRGTVFTKPKITTYPGFGNTRAREQV